MITQSQWDHDVLHLESFEVASKRFHSEDRVETKEPYPQVFLQIELEDTKKNIK